MSKSRYIFEFSDSEYHFKWSAALCLLETVVLLLEDRIHKSLGKNGIILFSLANYAIAIRQKKEKIIERTTC